ncbi:hypothetical protein K1W69_17275 [Hoeflea sp. WL0058]|uniref:Peptidase S24/S26A/S26B/S26C domain-containing protein n=1 Tax=Flavimaribacter sediminis TaxID=2865987 RepID=A0AAE2ZMJ5_9HYPH|nr:S24 family peptidase [Flavimaribacter sediminis]MBW8638951.1 hypothetical protein [Flavimaribacter sediminis]
MSDGDKKSINLDYRKASAEKMVKKYEELWKDLDPELAGLARQVTEATEIVGGRKAAAEIMGVGQTTLDNYRSGKTQPKTLEYSRLIDARGLAIANYFDNERAAIGKRLKETLDGNKRSLSKTDNSERSVAVARYAVQASAGGGSVVLAEEVSDYFRVGRAWLERYVPRGARTGIIEARGDSMEPTIRDGDILLLNFEINRQDVANGGVFVISIDGHLYVKRLQILLDGSIKILSDNKNYDPETVDREYADEKMMVHARVVWAGGPLR